MCEYNGPRTGLKWLSHQGECDECRFQSWRDYEPPRIVFGAVPGGTTKASISKGEYKDFNEGMHAYREARRHGLQPEQISKKAVEKAEQIAYGARPVYDSGVRS